MAVVTSRSLSPWCSLLFTGPTQTRRCSRYPSVSSARLAVNIRRTAGRSRTNEPGHHSITLRSARACARSRTAIGNGFCLAIAVDSSEIFRSSWAREAEKSRAIRWRPARYFRLYGLNFARIQLPTRPQKSKPDRVDSYTPLTHERFAFKGLNETQVKSLRSAAGLAPPPLE